MDPSRDPFLRRQILSQQPMSIASSLPSGQAYYTLESLEGATSLPFLKPAPPASLPRRDSFPPSLPLSSERDALLRLDAQQRALLADRETLDARARLLAAQREALLRNMPGGANALPNQRMYADGLQALDAHSRVLLDGLQNLDPRSRALLDNGRVISQGLEVRPGAPLADNRGLSYGLDTRPLQLGVRAPPGVGGIAPGVTEHGSLSELLRGRELGVGAPFLPAADPALVRRDIGRAEVPDIGAQSARLFANGSRELAAVHSVPAPAEVKKPAERNKALSSSAPAKKKPPPEQSDGWCAVCKIDCNNIKTLGIHVNGKKHKAAVELLQLRRNTVKVQVASTAVPSTSQADKKRASDDNPETSQSAKRFMASTPVVAAPTAVATDKADSKKAKPVLSNPSHQFCELCNISTTGKTNLESHLKGKRHAARVKELANPPLVSAT